ncbi:hypothetical protein EVAR_17228_1 [Eumeta japonica]|uniref:Uncharacterized protein n=1 Tax=Eumeta variegata TaxID=151549 RepID=A0A4C1UAG1_EUMVA|nr:hypothetical protein EVAR_17228_1 [Eumeta japonica]
MLGVMVNANDEASNISLFRQQNNWPVSPSITSLPIPSPHYPIHHSILPSIKYPIPGGRQRAGDCSEHHFDGWPSITVCYIRNFLLRTVTLWNDSPSAVFPVDHDKVVFNKRAYSFFKVRQRTNDSSGVASVHGQR